MMNCELIQNLIQCGQIETIHHVANQTLEDISYLTFWIRWVGLLIVIGHNFRQLTPYLQGPLPREPVKIKVMVKIALMQRGLAEVRGHEHMMSTPRGGSGVP